MKQYLANNTQRVQMEQYEAPCMEVIEMEIEDSILKASDANTTFSLSTEDIKSVNW